MAHILITTPIYYANAKMHLGNIYTTIVADVYARYKRSMGHDVIFCTGTDENGQKMVQVAQAQGKDVMTFLDEIVAIDQEVMAKTGISYDDFIRTTEPRHHRFVSHILRKTYEAGAIYQGEYEGLYCVGCEGFKKESDLINGLCPDHQKQPERIQEKNRFFRLSDYQSRLEDFFASHPTFIQPNHRYNEVKAFVAGGLEDFSISRQGSTFGIPIPRDPTAVTYIWYDALLNYLTVAVDHRDGDTPVFKPHASQMVHTLGKDIVRFHAIYRPAMLMAADLEHLIPVQEFVGGFFTVDGQKMSKSLGNVIYADEVCEQYGRDALVFYLMYDIGYGSDGDFSWSRFHDVQQSMLMGGRGNLVSRVTKLAQTYSIDHTNYHSDCMAHLATINQLGYICDGGYDVDIVDRYMDTADFSNYLKDRYALVQEANKYMQDTQPRKLLKSEKSSDRESGTQCIEHLLWFIKQLAILASPFLIQSTERCHEILGITLNREIFDVSRVALTLHPDVIYVKNV